MAVAQHCNSGTIDRQPASWAIYHPAHASGEYYALDRIQQIRELPGLAGDEPVGPVSGLFQVEHRDSVDSCDY